LNAFDFAWSKHHALSPMNRPASFRAVKFFPLLAIAFLTGCTTQYTKLTVTDHQGDRIATWIAEGHVARAEQGYRIRAVERTSGPPNEIYSQYPNGWRSIVIGPNIMMERVEKPLWLAELDGEIPPAPVTKTVTTEKKTVTKEKVTKRTKVESK
jgi:hypothetical protein